MLIKVISDFFSCHVIVDENGVIVNAEPILRGYVNKTVSELRKIADNYSWDLEFVDNDIV